MASAQERRKNPTSKLYVADQLGEAQIDTGTEIDDLTKKSVYNAEGRSIETKANSNASVVLSNGTGIYFDVETRVKISTFQQEAFRPNRADVEDEPSISTTHLMVEHGVSPTELLENPVFAQLIERLKKIFDLVVIDSPPMGAVTDATLIAERTDEVVYVCRFNRAYRKHIKLYIKALREGKNEILGIVLNGLSPRRIEYYSNYRYYRSYKKYYGSQT